MTGKSLDWEKICKLHFGAYTQVHKDRNVTNPLEERTQGEIIEYWLVMKNKSSE